MTGKFRFSVIVYGKDRRDAWAKFLDLVGNAIEDLQAYSLMDVFTVTELTDGGSLVTSNNRRKNIDYPKKCAKCGTKFETYNEYLWHPCYKIQGSKADEQDERDDPIQLIEKRERKQ